MSVHTGSGRGGPSWNERRGGESRGRGEERRTQRRAGAVSPRGCVGGMESWSDPKKTGRGKEAGEKRSEVRGRSKSKKGGAEGVWGRALRVRGPGTGGLRAGRGGTPENKMSERAGG